MDGNLNNNVICCFCGESLKIQEAVIINVQPSINSQERQSLFAHKQHFVDSINKAIPLHPDFFEDGEN